MQLTTGFCYTFRYTATPLAPATNALFTLDEDGSGNTPTPPPYRAVYPFSVYYGNNTVMFPSIQATVDGSLTQFPMYAESNSNKLAFKNLCGVLRVHLTKSNTSVSSVSVTVGSPINGKFDVDYNGGNPVLAYVSSGTNTNVLTCSVAQSISEGKDFFIYLPAGDYDNLRLDIGTTDGRYCVKTANTTIRVVRSKITSITLGESNLQFLGQEYASGKLPGLFSVSPTQQVHFAQGNLQYRASTTTWRFALRQVDYVGNASLGNVFENGQKSNNEDISSTYSGWIDLFGWGTGDDLTNTTDRMRTFVDWGSNAISNGGNVANAWRTLASTEWEYLLNTRTSASSKWGRGRVNGVYGMVLLPDTWTIPEGLSFSAEQSGWVSGHNNYTLSQWARMESAGAVFLTGEDYRQNSSFYGEGWSSHPSCHYWSSTEYWSRDAQYIYAYAMYCQYTNMGVIRNNQFREEGYSVRLVQDND